MSYSNNTHPIEELLRLEFIENGDEFTDSRNQNYKYDEEERPPFEPSHDSNRYKDWEYRERLLNDWMELQGELVKLRRQ